LVAVRISELVKEISYVSEIFVANTFTQATEIVDKQQPHVVLLDVFLAEENGIDVLKYVRTHFPSMKVIIVTNKVSEYYRNVCKELGADGFIDKSAEFEKISGIIENTY
jgi:DNA-binding NarL/FixJ family response regulator